MPGARWSAGTLSFDTTMAATAHTLSAMLSLAYGGQTLSSVTVDGAPVGSSVQTIKGVSVAFVSLAAGNHTVTATYGGPTPTPTNTPTIRPTPAPVTNTPTATPTALPGTPTPTLTPSGSAFPATGVLDNFNGANGALGSNWSGSTTGYSVAGNQLDVGAGGDVYGAPSSFGAEQEAYVTFAAIDPASSEMDLLLKSQNSVSLSNGVIEVWYDAANRRAQVWTYTSRQGWVQRGPDIPAPLVTGDLFGARHKRWPGERVPQRGLAWDTGHLQLAICDRRWIHRGLDGRSA
jgi:hypothetical protein